MDEEKIMITIALAVVLVFIGFCGWLVIARPQFDSGEIPDTHVLQLRSNALTLAVSILLGSSQKDAFLNLRSHHE